MISKIPTNQFQGFFGATCGGFSSDWNEFLSLGQSAVASRSSVFCSVSNQNLPSHGITTANITISMTNIKGHIPHSHDFNEHLL